MFLWFLQWWYTSATIPMSKHKQNWKLGDTNINLVSLVPLQLTKFQKFWVSECLLYKCTLLTTIHLTGNIITVSVFFHSKITLTHLHLAINNIRNFSKLPRIFPCDQNYVNLSKIVLSTKCQVRSKTWIWKSSVWLAAIAYKKFVNQIGTDVDITSLILRYQFKYCWHLGRKQ